MLLLGAARAHRLTEPGLELRGLDMHFYIERGQHGNLHTPGMPR